MSIPFKTSGVVARSLALALALAALAARPAAAQTEPLSQLLSDFITSATRLDATLTPDDHSAHFTLDSRVNEVPGALNRSLGLQLTTFPFTSDWPGVRHVGGGVGAAANRALFGSSFAERGTTSGAGRFGLGYSQHTAQFKWLDGLDLRRGVTLYFRHSEHANPGSPGDLLPASERDLLRQSIAVRLDRTIFNVALSYGVSDRLDVGLLVPIAKVSFDARIFAEIVRTATADTPEVHTFDRLELNHQTTYATRNVHGIGDLQVRGKFQLAGDHDGGIATALAVSLPTGRSEDFLGSGTTAAELSVMWSARKGALGPHVNASYGMGFGSVETDSGAGDLVAFDLPRELSVVAGLDIEFHPRWTVSGDILGRRLQDVTRFSTEDVVFPARGPGPLPAAAAFTATGVAVVGPSSSLNQMYAVVGTKILVGRDLLFHGDVVLPLVKNGLTPRPVAVAGVGLAF
jgi:hypothetical protein